MKKYTSTTRLVNTIIFGILFVGFATLAVFFSFLFAPKVIMPSYLSGINYAPTGKPYAFVALLGITGFALALISAKGLINSVKSLMKESDEELVRKSFYTYFALGYAVSIFFFFNALWLFNQIGGTTVPFWIILSVILCIVALIATNVPMMKMLEDKDPRILSKIFNGTMFAVLLSCFVTFFWTYVVALIQNEGGKDRLKLVLLVLTLVTFVGSLITGFGYFGYSINLKKEKANDKLNQLTWAGVASVGALPLASGILETVLIYNTRRLDAPKISLMTSTFAGPETNVVVMGYITGCLLIVAALVVSILGLFNKKKAK